MSLAHKRSTRSFSSDNLAIRLFRTSRAQRSIKYQGSKVWNSISTAIQRLKVKKFTQTYGEQILVAYKNEVSRFYLQFFLLISHILKDVAILLLLQGELNVSIILLMKANKGSRLTQRLHVPSRLPHIAIIELQLHVCIRSVFFLFKVFLSTCCNMKIIFVCLSKE